MHIATCITVVVKRVSSQEGAAAAPQLTMNGPRVACGRQWACEPNVDFGTKIGLPVRRAWRGMAARMSWPAFMSEPACVALWLWWPILHMRVMHVLHA